MKLEYEYDSFEYGGEEECYLIVLEADIIRVDEGIGSYEFWGTTGYDVNWVSEIESIECIKVVDSMENEIIPDEEMLKAIRVFINDNWEDLYYKFMRRLEEYDGYDDYDPY